MLSKSRYIYGLQCHLRLWNHAHRRELAAAPSANTRALFDFGTRIGELATRRYPGGVAITAPHYEREQAIAQTVDAMNDASVAAIYEAAFSHGGVHCRVDVLQRAPTGGWNLIEVKSTARPKQHHKDDVAIQLWVLRGAGVAVNRAGLLTLNRNHAPGGGDESLQRRFAYWDLTDELFAMQGEVTANVAAQRALLRRDEPPHIAIGAHCTRPYSCPFLDHCGQSMAMAV